MIATKIKPRTGVIEVLKDGKKVGTFDDALEGEFRFFAQNPHLLTGDDYLEIGNALNNLNKQEQV